MRITKDDDRARRICSLALAFMNAHAPVPSSEVARRFYPELSADSFRRAFARDRVLLAACGVSVCEGPRGTESSWVADEGRSFAGEVELGPADAAILEIACQPLLEDPEFPFAGDLRFALAKLTRTFAYSTPLPSGGPREESRVETSIKDVLVRGRGLAVTYTDAAGRTSERRLAPYGIFGLRGATYLVAARLDGSHGNDEVPRTYRTDRISSCEVLEDVAVTAPEDFSVADWKRLPFQLGPIIGRASFRVPREREGDLRRASGGRGTLQERGGGLVWDVDFSDALAAASWAVSQGMEPLSPEPVVSAAKKLLKGAAHDAS